MHLPIRAAVVTVSDGVTQGTRVDESGDVAETMLREAGFEIGTRVVVPDERVEIERTLRRLVAGHELVVTTGGTGFGPRDVTPEATRSVIDREAPGLAELMRAEGLRRTPMAAPSLAAWPAQRARRSWSTCPDRHRASARGSRLSSRSCHTRSSCSREGGGASDRS